MLRRPFAHQSNKDPETVPENGHVPAAFAKLAVDTPPGADAENVANLDMASLPDREPAVIANPPLTQPSSPSTTMQFTYPAGSKPLSRYTVRRGIGIGGFGEVYFAVSDAGKEVALKRIQRNLEVELRGVSHCLNLKHHHLVSLYDVCQDDDGQWWVVMEYVAGPNLRQVLDDAPDGLPANEVRRWLSAITAGVSHLHQAGLVHRDLKPANVFDDLGTVKVGDYGLSKFISATHRGGHTESVGTFHYMAPEIGNGQYGRQIDIYAIGIILHEMLTGEVPFDGETAQEIVVKHLTAVPDLSRLAQPYRTVVAKCLEKDPAARYENIESLTQALGLEQSHASRVTTPIVDTVSEHPLWEHHWEHHVEPSEQDAGQDAEQNVQTALAEPPEPNMGSGPAEQTERPGSEPIARAIRASFTDLGRWWRSLDQSPGAKTILLIASCVLVLINTHWLLPLLSLLAMVYLPYYVVRQMILQTSPQPTYAQAHAEASARQVNGVRQMSRPQWRQQVRSQLAEKRSIDRGAELTVSWVAALMCVFMLGMVSCLVGLRHTPVNATAIAPYVWTATVVLFASGIVLGLGKLWEKSDGERLLRRLALAATGSLVGLFAFLSSSFFLLSGDQGLARNIDASGLPSLFYDESGPKLTAMMAHFAILFAIVGWWKRVDPLRRNRLSLWSIAVAVVAEWGVHQVMPIAQPWGMLITGGLAVALQMSAPWINPKHIHWNPLQPTTVTWQPVKKTHARSVRTGGSA